MLRELTCNLYMIMVFYGEVGSKDTDCESRIFYGTFDQAEVEREIFAYSFVKGINEEAEEDGDPTFYSVVGSSIRLLDKAELVILKQWAKEKEQDGNED